MQYTQAELERRMARVRVLLEAMDSTYEDLLSRQERDVTGFAEPRVVRYRCGHCGGDGCTRCHNGRVDVEERDPYDTGIQTIAEQQRPATMSEREVDNALRRLRDDELKRAGVIADLPWQKAFVRSERLDRTGDFERLRTAVGLMPRELAGERAVRWLAEHIAGRIRVPHWARERERELLRFQTRELRELGMQVSEIASHLGVSQRQVKNLLAETR